MVNDMEEKENNTERVKKRPCETVTPDDPPTMEKRLCIEQKETIEDDEQKEDAVKEVVHDEERNSNEHQK